MLVRGRTSAPASMVLGHEITGEVIEKSVSQRRLRSSTPAPDDGRSGRSAD
jgi:hypothetical protein